MDAIQPDRTAPEPRRPYSYPALALTVYGMLAGCANVTVVVLIVRWSDAPWGWPAGLGVGVVLIVLAGMAAFPLLVRHERRRRPRPSGRRECITCLGEGYVDGHRYPDGCDEGWQPV